MHDVQPYLYRDCSINVRNRIYTEYKSDAYDCFAELYCAKVYHHDDNGGISKKANIISAMQVVKCPNAVAIPFIVLLRYIPTVTEDYRCLKDSLKIRGISVSAVQFFIHPIRTLEFLIVPILLRSVRVAEELSASLLLRGIEAFKDRTNLYPLQFKTIDYVYICSALMSVVVIGVL